MTIPSSYFLVQKNISSIMDSMQRAGVPEKFTLTFLESLGFKSTNDRPIIAMLKTLGFLDENGVPTDFYRAYKDPAKSKKVLGQRLKEVYKDIFLADEKAQDLSIEKLKGIFASLSGKGDAVVTKMASTFKSFCAISEFTNLENLDVKQDAVKQAIKENLSPVLETGQATGLQENKPEFHYNIQIHLPVTRDISVYNAIFKSLKEHLL